MGNTINGILKEVRENTISEVLPSKYKFAHSVYSNTENMMNNSDYSKHLHDVKIRGELNHPIIIVNSKILDGRNRQKACIELDIPMKVLYLKDTYTDEVLYEYVRSIHMTKSKNAVQKQIQAYRFKQTVGNVTWLQAAEKYGSTERSVKTINTLYNTLNANGYASDFTPLIGKLFMGLNIKPTDYEWVSGTTASCYSLHKQLKEYVNELYKSPGDGDIDTTEVDPDTGEFLEKQNNYYNNVSDKSDKTKDLLIEQLKKELQELQGIVKALQTTKPTPTTSIPKPIETSTMSRRDTIDALVEDGWTENELINYSDDELKYEYENI